jgi:hypothetical protein
MLPVEKYDAFCKILKKKYELPDRRETTKDDKKISFWTGIVLIPEYATNDGQERFD